MTTKDQDMLGKTADALTQSPIVFTITRTPKTLWQGILDRIGLFNRARSFDVYPLKMGTVVRISKLLLQIPERVFEQHDLQGDIYRAIVAHADDMAEIIALAFANSRQKAPKGLIRLVKEEFTTAELLGAVQIIQRQMDVMSFTSTIVLTRRLQLLQKASTSPMEPEEFIASGERSEASASTSGGR